MCVQATISVYVHILLLLFGWPLDTILYRQLERTQFHKHANLIFLIEYQHHLNAFNSTPLNSKGKGECAILSFCISNVNMITLRKNFQRKNHKKPLIEFKIQPKAANYNGKMRDMLVTKKFCMNKLMIIRLAVQHFNTLEWVYASVYEFNKFE